MSDRTEGPRRQMSAAIHAQIESDDPAKERTRLEALHGRVWDTEELKRDFEVHGFFAPMVMVTRKEDGMKGVLAFQHWPRFYFDFMGEGE